MSLTELHAKNRQRLAMRSGERLRLYMKAMNIAEIKIVRETILYCSPLIERSALLALLDAAGLKTDHVNSEGYSIIEVKPRKENHNASFRRRTFSCDL